MIIEREDPNNGGSRKIYEKVNFDSAGRLAEVIDYRGDGAEMPPTKYLYNGVRLVKEQNYKIDGTVWNEASYSYAASGEILSKIKIDITDGSLLSKTIYSTSPKNSTIEVIEYNPAGNPRTDIIYTKDPNGRISEMEVKKGVLKGKRSLKYNNKGDMCQISVQSSDSDTPLIITYRYDYDTHGNWVKRVEASAENNTESESVSEIVYRTISYY